MLPGPERIVRLLGEIPKIRKFVLIGGTAIALQTRHRDSEDLDFAYLDRPLPRSTIRAICDALRSKGVSVEKVQSLSAAQERENAGFDLDDAQQDYVADGTKLSFFILHDEERAALADGAPREIDGIRVAGLETLFRLKALLLTHRITRRDLYDLYFFTHDQGRPASAIFDVIHRHAPHYRDEVIKHRLLTQPFRADDPGFDSLVSRRIDVETIRAWFEEEISRLEVERAESAAREADSGSSPGPG